MSTAQLGKVLPALKLPATGDKIIDIKSLRGKNIVIYFYPKDSTPGCTTEGQDFAANHAKFKRQNTVILGVSETALSRMKSFVKNTVFLSTCYQMRKKRPAAYSMS